MYTCTAYQPDGGVKKGEKFVGTVVSTSSAGHNIPEGKWRDGICNFIANGICHPMCCLACWCSPLALGQVASRMKLDAKGNPLSSSTASWWTAFKVIALVLVMYIGVDQTFSIFIDPYFQFDIDDETGQVVYADASSVPTWIAVIVALRAFVRFVFFAYILFMTIRTRAYIRHKYAIEESACRGCEDCCCAFWLPCCTITQMARHTADYNTYHAACCTDTGLPPQAPEVV